MTAIEWADETWNPVRGCSRVSKGCEHCYAERFAARMSGPGKAYDGLVETTPKGPRWTGRVVCDEKALEKPLRWRKPRRVFVNSMGDLFHEAVPDDFIHRVMAVVALAPRHDFIVLTKRPERMLEYFTGAKIPISDACGVLANQRIVSWDEAAVGAGNVEQHWPLPNLWLGVSVEDQATADERIPILLETSAALRFVSYEPVLGPVDFERYFAYLDWLIVGGESGPRARPCRIEWLERAVEQCAAAGVPVFVKQLGAVPIRKGIADLIEFWPTSDRAGRVMDDWPLLLRCREYPVTR